MRFGISSPAFLLIILLGSSSPLAAQRTQPPTLDQILARLQANLDHDDAKLPSLFCDEHVLSSRIQPNTRDQNTVTDSIFRLRRTPQPNHTTALVESREIKTVDGKPATSQDMDGPALLSGIFEGGLAVVSLSQKACMDYTLQPISKRHPAKPYAIRFATLPKPADSCFLQEKSKGQVLIDPASMQVTHLEIMTPHHTIQPGSAFSPRIMGKRALTVDYAPVLLGGETFWLPSSISMQTTTGSGTFHETLWSFRAAYRNYHRLEVTTRILPASEALLR